MRGRATQGRAFAAFALARQTGLPRLILCIHSIGFYKPSSDTCDFYLPNSIMCDDYIPGSTVIKVGC